MANELKVYCKEHGYDNPKFWPASCTKDYAVSIHMRGNDRWEEFDADVVFLLDKQSENEQNLLEHIIKKVQEPVVLTVPLSESVSHQNLYNNLGLTLMPGRWTDKSEEEYEVYVKGQINMGGFVNLMERVKSIGSEIVTTKRPFHFIFLSFVSFKLSQILVTRHLENKLNRK